MKATRRWPAAVVWAAGAWTVQALAATAPFEMRQIRAMAKAEDAHEYAILGIKGSWEQISCDLVEGGKKGDPAARPRELGFGDFLKSEAGQAPCVAGHRGGALWVLFQTGPTSYACEEGSRGDRLPPTGMDCAWRVAPSNAAAPVWVARMLGAFKTLLKEHPQEFVVTGSRGVDPELVDAVVPLRGNRIDLAAAMKELPAGRYQMRLAPRSGKRSTGATNWITLDWDQKDAFVDSGGFSSGILELQGRDADGSPTGPPAWVLVAPEANYEAFAEAFRQAEDLFRTTKVDQPRQPGRLGLEALSRGLLARN
jgi:hypothetical protein